jgi:hypothetical protein
MTRALSVGVAAVLLAGCGAQPGAPSAMPLGSQAAARTERHRSWMLPQAATSDLLYFSAPADQFNIYVYTFPKGVPVGAIQDFGYPEGLCSDSAGDVFVVNNSSKDVAEYAHGALLPKATLAYPGGQPTGCALDSTTGDLAVMDGEDLDAASASFPFDVWIYTGAKAKPKRISGSGLAYPAYLCYDNSGNLIVDGKPGQGNLALFELPKGGSSFTEIKLDSKTRKDVRSDGSIQWVGTYLAVVDDEYPNDFIDRLTIHGTEETYSGKTTLLDSTGVSEFWIADGRVAAGQNDAAAIWKYPAGGDPVLTLSQVTAAYGVTLSVAQK